MASFEFMLAPLLLSWSSFTDVTRDVIHVKNLICPQFTNVALYGHQSSQEYSIIAAELLQNANFSIQLNSGLKLRTDKCAIIFTEQPDVISKHAMNYASPFRGIIVTSRAALNSLSSYRRYSFVYVLYDDDIHRFGFYNRFQKQFHRMSHLEYDPVLEAQRNLHGYRLMLFPTKHDHHIFETAVARRNGTYRVGMTTEISTVLTHFDVALLDSGSNNIFLHTTAQLCFIVPRSKVKPLITILSDPFDETSWILYLASAVTIAVFEVLLSNQRKHVLSGIEKVAYLLWMALTGSDVQVSHEVSRCTTAIWLLMNVILVSAYQSLIISFLQQPRYYSDFKTLQQMNQSCCWVRSYTANIASYDLYQNYPCEEKVDFFRLKLHELEQENYCLLEMCPMLEMYLELMSDIAQHYRVDHGGSSFHPVFLNVKYQSPVYELLQFYVNIFLEGDLSRYYLLKYDRTSASRAKMYANHENGGSVQPISVEDISLTGIVLAAGAMASGLSFVLECIFSRVRHWRAVKKGIHFLRKIKLL